MATDPYRDFTESLMNQLDAENRRLQERVEFLTFESFLKDEAIAELRSNALLRFFKPWILGLGAIMLVGIGFLSSGAEEPRREIPPPDPPFMVTIHQEILIPDSICEACGANRAVWVRLDP